MLRIIVLEKQPVFHMQADPTPTRPWREAGVAPVTRLLARGLHGPTPKNHRFILAHSESSRILFLPSDAPFTHNQGKKVGGFIWYGIQS